MQVDIDILVYAVIAALLLGRLWSVFGTRNGNETQRPNPFTPPPAPPPSDEAYAAPQQITSPRMLPPALPPASLEGGLAQVRTADASFDEKQFLQTARDIFGTIVSAYASGNLAPIAEFLSPPLLDHFQQAVNARKAEGQTAQSRVARYKEVEAIAAKAIDKQATVTVRFVTDQENILRNAEGTIIGGTTGKLEEVTDIWTFTKDAQTPDPKWIVVETKG